MTTSQDMVGSTASSLSERDFYYELAKRDAEIDFLKTELLKLGEKLADVHSNVFSSFKEDLLKRFEQNKKDIIKQSILEHAAGREMTKLDLKRYFVDSKRACAKSSFYRYLYELELEQKYELVKINRKEIVVPVSRVLA